ncbi:glycerophosphodiester phosphodiesterase family protein [uncultured Alsobacter sp.]|uniref:glycerophosphodiester phosphodiesterase n=1 Tax=uncultured Alsobacter sp. TaxID=1748258 RepID=UPI0025CFB876|nr:glycerophosphodiester phosphodiesterase family protein [uncultured Alsobacter sp.]
MTDIASHRGGAMLWPENSRLAFRNSTALPVEFIEFDVHRSRDGVLLVHHDSQLGRTARGSGAIAEMDWEQLSAVPLLGTDGETIPTFEEVLDIIGPSGIGLRIEIKTRHDGGRYAGIEQAVVDVLARRGLLARTTFTSFDLPTLATLAGIAPGAPAIWLVADRHLAPARDIASLCRKAKDAGAGEIALRASKVEDADAAACHAAGIRFGVYGAHDEATIRWAFATGVTVFTTDRPDLAIALRPTAG